MAKALRFVPLKAFWHISVEYDPTFHAKRTDGTAWHGKPGPPPRITWEAGLLGDTTHVDVTAVMIK